MINSKCETLKKAIDSMEADFVSFVTEAEKKNDMSLVIKGNALKRKCESSMRELKKLEEQHEELKSKRKKL